LILFETTQTSITGFAAKGSLIFRPEADDKSRFRDLVRPRRFWQAAAMIQDAIRRTPRPQDLIGMSTQELRDAFQISNLFSPGELTAHFTELDRLVVGGVMPTDKPLELPNHKETGRAFFLERRELGVINVGGAGKAVADGQTFALDKLDCAYLPMGTKSVSFMSDDAKNPAKFYFLSCLAHAAHPMRMMKSSEAAPVRLGAQETGNQRTIFKFIHQGGIQSCQLVMGLTALEPGNVWNSFPPHTHWRRTEIYFYFDLGDKIVSHFFGEPSETRHLFLHNEEVALSPNWSMHFGVGTGNYKFIWGMAGENQVFDDMDAVKTQDLR
jgi:4-deoxy-L-threo-5-hexosulose-uronate ketol-isomerase